MKEPDLEYIAVGSPAEHIARRVALRKRGGASPCVVWLGGFRSDMMSTKVLALDAWARDTGQAFLRFDYSGHGESESAAAGEHFTDGTISRWLEDALSVMAQVEGPLILVGSSMGGWISLLAARALQKAEQGQRLAGMVLIAPAVDFTESLMWAHFPPQIKAEIMEKGSWCRPTPYAAASYPVTRALIEDGRRHLLFGGPIDPGCPVHILQGQQDPDVPWQHAMRLMEHLPQTKASLTLIKDGEHRLSREQDIRLLIDTVANMVSAARECAG